MKVQEGFAIKVQAWKCKNCKTVAPQSEFQRIEMKRIALVYSLDVAYQCSVCDELIPEEEIQKTECFLRVKDANAT